MTTILAAFENGHIAQKAIKELAKAGVVLDDVHIESDLARLKHLDRSRSIGNDSVLGSVGRMFADLVRTNVDYHHVDIVTEAIERGATMLVARVTDPAVVSRAPALLRQFGAYDVGTQAAAAPLH
jgi:glutaredoxin-related protein